MEKQVSNLLACNILLLLLNIVPHSELSMRKIKLENLNTQKELLVSQPPTYSVDGWGEKTMSVHFWQTEVTNGLNLNRCGSNHKVIKVI